MRRNHNYSCSSDSELDDNIEVEKDSGDENVYVENAVMTNRKYFFK